ncbi:MAG: peptide-methionine (R)-S-oxide reductase MsrB [Magnetococcales bacterium]|nr:peptide-methionine (R)-S-oxide reductase MsrB [Magnetococcales bacterium]
MKRRVFLLSCLALGSGVLVGRRPLFAASGRRDLEKMVKSDKEWREILPPEVYDILRLEGTEPPFTSALNGEKRSGIYHCAGCDLKLFTSQMKYDSGTGWPSFTESIAGRLETKLDFKLILPRTEYHCARCGGHQGHVFDDGPSPLGKRWCNNGLALRFVPS